MGVWIWVHQHAVNHAEHRCCGADAERQRKNGNDRESRILQQHPQSVTPIISSVSQPSPSPNVPRHFLHQSHVPKLPPHRALRLVCHIASFHTLPCRHLQVALHFLFEFRIPPITPPESHTTPLRFLTSLLPYFLASSLLLTLLHACHR